MKNFYSKYQLYFFLFFVIILFFSFSAFTILFQGPFGIHYIRQTDSISFVANYYRNGFRFFHPEIFNLSIINGNNACEFPIFYYLTALLYKVLGEKEYLLRFWSFLFSFISLIYLYLLANKWIKNNILATLVCLLCISSPIYLYYFFNFLPDSISLACTVIAWYYFTLFYENNKQKHWIIALGFFTLASLLKATYFLHPIAAFLALFFTIYFQNRKNLKIYFNRLFLISCFVSLCLLFFWYFFMYWYNNLNNAHYFTTSPLPYWETSYQGKKEVFDSIRNYWFSDYYYPSLIHVFYFLIGIHLVFWKKTDKIYNFLSVFLILGLSVYFLLFFMQFKSHDYYMLNMYPLFWMIGILSFSKINSFLPKKMNVFYILVLIVLLFASVKHTQKKMEVRWNIDTSKDYYANIENKLKYTSLFIENHKISPKSKWIIFTDRSPSGALLKIKRKGWNIIDTIPETIHLYPYFLSQNPDYILFTDKSYLEKYRQKNMKLIGKEHNNYIYQILTE
ncbi:MAG: glycosyltransferase family 39 protein [Flavobacteriia bacterium]|nr:glycosyltransferase family 39 protein [Flavobacteriia bacterium]